MTTKSISWHQYVTVLKRNLKLLRRSAKFQIYSALIFFGILATSQIISFMIDKPAVSLSIPFTAFLIFAFQIGTVSKLVTFMRKEKDNKFLSIYKFMGLKETPYYIATLTSFYLFSAGGMLCVAILGSCIKLFGSLDMNWICFWLLSSLFLISCCNYAAIWSLIIRGTEDVAAALTNLMMFIMSFM